MIDPAIFWLLVWGTVVGLDLATGPQVMAARPLVAGTIAGALAGDLSAGVAAGVVLELFALDYLPVGAARYPDYGIGAVVAAAAGAGAPHVLGLGVAVAVGLATAYVGEGSITLLRRRNTVDVRRHAAALDAGDPRAIRAVHWRGIARDLARALVLTAFGLGFGAAVRQWLPITLRDTLLLTATIIGIGLAVALRGTLNIAGRGRGVAWMTVGVVGGIVWMLR